MFVCSTNAVYLSMITMFQGGNLRRIFPHDQHLLLYQGGRGRGKDSTLARQGKAKLVLAPFPSPGHSDTLGDELMLKNVPNNSISSEFHDSFW